MRTFFGLLVALMVANVSYSFPDKSPENLKPIMRGIFTEITFLLPKSLDDGVFFKPSEEEGIKAALGRLTQRSLELRKATANYQDGVLKSTGDEFAFLANEAEQSFRAGRQSKAQAMILFQTEACMTCHTMNKSQNEPMVPVQFLSNMQYDNLDIWAKARFMTMARQFREAMTEYENLLSSPALSTEEKVLSMAYDEYLILGLRVVDDDLRVSNFFKSRLTSKDPEIIKHSLNSWLADMTKAASVPKPWGIDAAKAFITMAEKEKRYPADHAALVYYIYASRVLRQVITENPPTGNERLAECQFLLGQAEMGIDLFNFKATSYFEKAIRLAPKTAIARKAFGQYEEYLQLSFSGSSGTNIPEEQSRRVKELQELMKR